MTNSNGPSKEQKYDRQLRLWQAHGQLALEDSKILAINACATVTESLKNLILPGIGSFTILDATITTPQDAGNNFFLDRNSLGKPRGECAVALLNELNPDVAGVHVFEDPSKIIAANSEFFEKFNLVIASQLSQADVNALSNICFSKNIPLMIVRAYGFIGYLRVQTNEHCIVESHPESNLDLRLDSPFKELIEYSDSFNLPALESMDFAHVPYAVILLKSLQEWKSKLCSKHNNALPQTGSDRNAFKDLVRSLKRPGVEDENFEEALVAVFRACSPTTIPLNISAILKESKSKIIAADTPSFWIIARAVANFVDETGYLPLAGIVPDMKADTESFVKLQTIYRDRAHQDALKIHTQASSLVSAAAVATPPNIEEVSRFCKNARNLRIVRTSSIASELTESSNKAAEIGRLAEDLESNIGLYLGLRAVDAFYTANRRFPGFHDQEVESDIGLLKKTVASMLLKMGLSAGLLNDDLIHEIVRAGASELHTMASLMGGICSQEAIKLITAQYVPLNNTFVYNGMKSVGGSFEF
ncbi:NEDD8-activating enzyme E1 regulatory subunit [Physocladia obscura]|uniref:NEDD8-activating enzyme E1 regulatory subunit n=1 Tax=Physocladia obscura TaxID=109957 RepID=A0AAD5T7Z3_9FUNG|nr:NEDD8-activating enzyme E1 regulatory subunit [Physocladia obscura]